MRVHRVLRQHADGAWTLLPALAGGGEFVAEGTLRLWRWRPSLDAASVRRAWDLLDEAEQARALRYRVASVQRRFIVTRAALRRLLARLCESHPAALRFEYNERGKPHLRDCPTLHFSLSHTAGLVLCATAARPLGVDVEAVREIAIEQIAPFVFTEAEQARMEGAQREQFFILWVRKEAYLKALGEGFAASPHRITTTPAPPGWWIADFVPAEGYRAAVALPREM